MFDDSKYRLTLQLILYLAELFDDGFYASHGCFVVFEFYQVDDHNHKVGYCLYFFETLTAIADQG